ncbi:MAG: DUF4136 domain-containing protein [Opitutales bacterium]
MKTPILAALSFSLALLVSCVSPTQYDYEVAAIEEMSAYRTFTIESRESRSAGPDVVLSPIVDRRIERAIERELVAKGFEPASTGADFGVTFNTVTKTRTEVNSYGPPPFRRHPYYGYNGQHVDIDQYEEGTFLIDIIDTKSKQLVWRGAYVKRLGWSAPNEAEVKKIVSSILTGFPPG